LIDLEQLLQKTYDLSNYNGKVIEVSFYFDMSDELANDYYRWCNDAEIQIENN
jgi:hypothetical protein